MWNFSYPKARTRDFKAKRGQDLGDGGGGGGEGGLVSGWLLLFTGKWACNSGNL